MELILQIDIDNDMMKDKFLKILTDVYLVDDDQKQILEKKFFDVFHAVIVEVKDHILDRFENHIEDYIWEDFEELSFNFIKEIAKEMNLKKKD